MNIVFPANTRDVIEDIIDAVGRDVTFYTSTLSGCSYSGDSLDPITNTSTNSFCPVCSGVWWIPTWSSNYLKAHVTWKYADQSEFHSGGYVFIGDGTVKIMYSGPYMDIVNSTEYMVVDGKQADIQKVTLLGIPSINRIILDFKERSNEDDTN